MATTPAPSRHSGVHLDDDAWDRLTRKVQQELNRLALNEAHAKKKLAAGPENSNTFADPYAEPPRPLGKDPRIRFGGAGYDNTFDVQYDAEAGALEIRGHEASGKCQMVIQPGSSNHFRAGFRERLS